MESKSFTNECELAVFPTSDLPASHTLTNPAYDGGGSELAKKEAIY